MKSLSKKFKAPPSLSDFLKKHRKNAGLTQREVAQKLDVHPMFISNIENNKAPLPYRHLKKISILYRLSNEELTEVLLKTHALHIKKFL